MVVKTMVLALWKDLQRVREDECCLLGPQKGLCTWQEHSFSWVWGISVLIGVPWIMRTTLYLWSLHVSMICRVISLHVELLYQVMDLQRSKKMAQQLSETCDHWSTKERICCDLWVSSSFDCLVTVTGAPCWLSGWIDLLEWPEGGNIYLQKGFYT